MAKSLAVLSTLVFLLLTACVQDETADVEAIDDVVARLDEAFQEHNLEAAKTLMTSDHIAVTPYYSGPQSFEEVVATFSEYKIKQTNLSAPEVQLLGSDYAMRTWTAKLEGAFKDRTISDKVFITSVMVKQDGKWLEKFYQVTAFAP